ncbi:endonuclease III domain-containing protein [Sporobolomyces koalae]|uniref:endonuclease III domain-containing protein n=1 Tax=Sporobolomyces koalae TaxID=500713 RepID=UPI00318040C6
MPAIRTRKSSLSSQVTLYEPDVGTARQTPPPPPLRRSTRSTRSTPLFDSRSDSDDSSEEDKPEVAVKVKQEATPRKATPRKLALTTPHPAPKNWQRQYEVIEHQRRSIVAPVDLMGCEQGGHDVDSKPVVPLSRKDKKLSTLVSLMLSSQTKDPVTHLATQNLRLYLPTPGLSLESLLEATVEQIDECIKKVGFHTTKAHNLKLMAEKVRDEHAGEVPEDLDKLLEFRGVGPKMAFIAMSSYGYNIGIGVDTHVHRITHRLRWHRKEPKNAEETRVNLESWLPRERWPVVNKMLVGFGQAVCKPVGPRCDLCHLGQQKLCPSRRTVVPPSPSKRAKKEEDLDEGKPKLEIAVDENPLRSVESLVVKIENDAEDKIKIEAVDTLIKVEPDLA